MRNASVDRFIEKLLRESSPDAPIWNLESILGGKAPHWNYIDGCMMSALWSLYEHTGDRRYARFVSEFLDYYIAADGTPLGYSVEEYNLDHIKGGCILFDIHKETGEEKYLRAIKLLRSQLDTHPRTREGSFWHKKLYPNQVWLDGLYMAQVFQTRWAAQYGTQEDFRDVERQFAVARERMLAPQTGLYCHGYDESRSIFWADPDTGRSKSHWLRAIGWFLAALADVLEYHPTDALAAQFSEAAAGLLPYADEETGLFWQVADKGGKQGNYTETSGSAMVAYAFLKGARLGFLPDTYRAEGHRTFEGICRHRLSEGEQGFNLSGICLVAGLGPENNPRRDGSFEYYLSEPVVENEAKGVAPFLMCYTEALRL